MFQSPVVIGRISELIVPEITSSISDGQGVLATVEIFELGGQCHPDFDMPILRRPAAGPKQIMFSAKVCILLYLKLINISFGTVHSFPIFCSA
jgi:hypothetical protein